MEGEGMEEDYRMDGNGQRYNGRMDGGDVGGQMEGNGLGGQMGGNGVGGQVDGCSNRKPGPKRKEGPVSHFCQNARKRRERLTRHIRQLEKLVPQRARSDAASVLESAISFIKRLSRENQDLPTEILSAAFPHFLDFFGSFLESPVHATMAPRLSEEPTATTLRVASPRDGSDMAVLPFFRELQSRRRSTCRQAREVSRHRVRVKIASSTRSSRDLTVKPSCSSTPSERTLVRAIAITAGWQLVHVSVQTPADQECVGFSFVFCQAREMSALREEMSLSV
ncbi:unnamed protein product [Closterium sp. Yama58-4]|nr:unnamed protein product [Closterium sp. Yama58-4]